MNFYNQVIDKKGLKRILSWFLENYGPTRTSDFIEYLKFLGFHYATRAGLSLGFDDLRIPLTKQRVLQDAQKQVKNCENNYLRGSITSLERYHKLIDIWTTTSENLKEEVIQNFQRTPLNPLYMMAFSGARGNISQVRQLVGMRGLMSDSGGGIIDFPIRSNFREGLSVTEYVISCYGARKGLIDTALRTADSGYLTRRLVDVAHGILIGEIDCFTPFSISVRLLEKNILGRVLAQNLETKDESKKTKVFAWKNQDISWSLSTEILSRISSQRSEIRVRSPLTCHGSASRESLKNPGEAESRKDSMGSSSSFSLKPQNAGLLPRSYSDGLCQLCYGWNLSQGRLVSIGDAVGVLAAQSIGEPGTQLTMRTFHTGGIFSTDVQDKIFSPHEGFVSFFYTPNSSVTPSPSKGCKVRSVHGETGFLTFQALQLCIESSRGPSKKRSIVNLPAQTLLFVYPGKYIEKNTLCAEVSRVRPPTIPTDLVEDSIPRLAKSQAIRASHEKLERVTKLSNQAGLAFGTDTRNEEKTSTRPFVENQIGKITGHKKEVDSGAEESSNHEENVHVKNVLSEIQGQIALPPPELSRGGQEVWVLAGEKYKVRKGLPRQKSKKSEIPASPGTLGTSTLLTTQGIFFHRGDIFSWAGSRYSKSSSALKFSSREGLKKTSRRPYEMREEVILSFQQQKKSTLLHKGVEAKLHQLCTSTKLTSQAIPAEPEKRISVAKPGRFVGDLIRNGNQLQYTAQIIRKKQKTRGLETKPSHESPDSKAVLVTQLKNKSEKITSYVLRRVQPHLFSGGGFPLDRDENNDEFNEGLESKPKLAKFKPKILNLRPIGSVVQERDMVFQLSLPVEQSKTGDIVQGLPKIEQLFEGRGGSLFDESVDQQGEKFARVPLVSNEGEFSPAIPAQELTSLFFNDPARKRFILQRRLVDEIQSVYQSQGVEIADKHVEIIVRQMTSKVKILEKASTPFFPDDIIDFESLRRINPEHTAYEPIIMGITKVAFFTDSFISAASFQETKRVLLQSAIQTRVDFLTGLKENVIVGRFIPAGTGQPVRNI